MVRFSFVSVILLSSVAVVVVNAEATSRRLSFGLYAGYSPLTQITDIAAIDLDQYDFNEQLVQRKLNNALHVYS